MTILDLPAVNASLNGLSAMFLTAGYIFIRQKNKIAHRNCMVAAFVTSIVFLICYLTYHTWLGVVLHRGPTRFLEPAVVPPVLSRDSAHPHRPGRRHCADDFDDPEPGAAARF